MRVVYETFNSRIKFLIWTAVFNEHLKLAYNSISLYHLLLDGTFCVKQGPSFTVVENFLMSVACITAQNY